LPFSHFRDISYAISYAITPAFAIDAILILIRRHFITPLFSALSASYCQPPLSHIIAFAIIDYAIDDSFIFAEPLIIDITDISFSFHITLRHATLIIDDIF
jgi:hypothetical protein